jgi:Flp pilus assembly protein TadG
MLNKAGFCHRMLRQRGAIGVMFAVTLVPMLAFAGLSVDFGRALMIRNQLGYALDAAALAVGSSRGTQAEMEARMRAFINANFPDQELAREVDFDLDIDGERVTASAEVSMPTTFMRVLGRDHLDIAVATEVVREISGIELALVLDVTGSMAGQKIADLRAAAHSLINIVFEDEQTPEFLKVAVVPYSAAVNLGSEASSFVQDSKLSHVTPAEIGLNPSSPEYSINRIRYDPGDPLMWKGCVAERSLPNDIEDTSISAGGYWRIYYWPSSYDNDWARAGVNTRTSDGNNMRGPNTGCPTPILPLTNRRQDVEDAIDGLVAWSRGGTMGNVGMAWGWRVLSPEPPFSENVLPYDEPLWEKAIVMMTDGDNLMHKWSPITDHRDLDHDGRTSDTVNNSYYSSDYSAYGRVEEGRLGTTSQSTASSRLDDRLEDVCDNIKEHQITIFTITFGGSVDNTTRSIYQHCATEPGYYFHAPTGSDLQQVFQTVGQRLSRLRVAS